VIWLAGVVTLLSVDPPCGNPGLERVVSTSPTVFYRRSEKLHTDSLRAGRFGQVVLYRSAEHPSNMVLFVSGDSGWNGPVAQMAESLARMDALVVGIDVREYLSSLARNSHCSYPAGDFEGLSQLLQHKLGFATYTAPVLVGYSSGAALVYAAMAQAPPNAFHGGISLAFCPVLRWSGTFCRGEGLPSTHDSRRERLEFRPAKAVEQPWIVIQGQRDSICHASRTEAFVRRVRGADFVLLPEVGHDLGDTLWLSALQQAFTRVSQPPPQPTVVKAPAVQDLPLVELPVRDSARQLAVVVTGDGGWASLDRRVGETLASHGVPVVGLNALQYFWNRKTPDEAGADFTRIIRHYLQQWGASDLILVGYSRGADVLPFMVTRLPSDLRSRIKAVALLAPERTADFEFHLTDLLGVTSGGDHPTVPEITRLSGLPVLCFYGSDETDSACPALPSGLATLVEMRGGHHFNGAYNEIARRILQLVGSH
jgi:type IV secretory pathway VirJ component